VTSLNMIYSSLATAARKSWASDDAAFHGTSQG